MAPHAPAGLEELPAATFDVLCAGETSWKLADPDEPPDTPRSGTKAIPLRPGGGSVHVAAALAREGLCVGLATVLTDDAVGRRSLDALVHAGVDARGVVLAPPKAGFLMVGAGGRARRVVPDEDSEPPFVIPPRWSARVLVLSGLLPVVEHAAAICRAARSARRGGALVVVDFNASLQMWAGRDPRTINSLLREVDVARCSIADLAVLGMDPAGTRAALRSSAVLVVSDGVGGAVATGPFGEARVVPAPPRPAPRGAGDAFTAGLCAALVRRPPRGESPGALWHRVLHHAASAAT